MAVFNFAKEDIIPMEPSFTGDDVVCVPMNAGVSLLWATDFTMPRITSVRLAGIINIF
jgi:hypothetical protein